MNGTAMDLGTNFTPVYNIPESKWDVLALYSMCSSKKLNFTIYIYQLDQRAIITPFLKQFGASWDEMMKYHNYHKENMYSWPPILQEKWELEGIITDDPSTADVYVIPNHAMDLFMVGHARKQKYSPVIGEYAAALIKAVSDQHPYWNRYGGFKHVLMMPNDGGRCDFTTPHIKELLRNTTILHPHGDKSADHVTCLGGVARDVIVPPRSILMTTWKGEKEPHTSAAWDGRFGPSRQTKHIASFVGSVNQGSGYSYGARQYLNKHMVGIPGFEYRERFKKIDDYVNSLSTSDFSLHIPGWQLWSPRLFDSIAFGSIPVLIGEYFVLPFEEFIPYDEFIVRIGWSQLRFLPEILYNISPQRRNVMREAMRPYAQYFLYSENAHQAIYASLCLKEKAIPIHYELRPLPK